MVDLSVKGVARRYAGTAGNFAVVGTLVGSFTGRASLRSHMEEMARTQHSFGMSECIYGWTASFEQTWTTIRIRIRLNPDAGISDATMNTLRNTWRNGIETTWSDQWGCARTGELTCRLQFHVDWVNSNQHHTVRVRPGPERSNMTTWDTADTGGVAAHEYGHMLGLVDEYPDSNCPDRDPVSTGTVMHNNSANVPARMMTRFANNIDSIVVGV